jgi:hypothetical protein
MISHLMDIKLTAKRFYEILAAMLIITSALALLVIA